MEWGFYALGALTGIFLGLAIHLFIVQKQLKDSHALAERIVQEAKKNAEAERKEYLSQAEAKFEALRREQKKEAKDRENELKGLSKKLQQREERLEQKAEKFNERESLILRQEKKLETRQGRLNELIEEQKRKLEQVGSLTAEEAKARLFKEVESQTRHESARMVRQIETEHKELANRKAREILALATQRYAGEFVVEHSVATVTLPNEEMKGRIIGREGRNIRALEAATGVDLLIDDTPETVVLSAFSPLRRQVAKLALERLIGDGRIHPARIEDVVKKVQQEMQVKSREMGEQATFDIGIHGIAPEIVTLLGQLQYRTSYSQNVLQHSLEVATLCGIMAAELGLDQKKAKRAGLLHDIGKAVDHEVEGPHALIGMDIAKKHGEAEDIVHAIGAHHEDIQPTGAIAILVQAADSLSGARPGARRELLENYVKRLEDLEALATDFEGVSKAFAIQAGREIRVIVDADVVNDDETYILCKDISQKIEDTLSYPGQIRVTCIREHRAVDYAK